MKTENEWLMYMTEYINKDEFNRAISWHIRLDLEDNFNLSLKTSKINYDLNKLVVKGFLTKVANKYCTEYKLIKDENSRG